MHMHIFSCVQIETDKLIERVAAHKIAFMRSQVERRKERCWLINYRIFTHTHTISPKA